MKHVIGIDSGATSSEAVIISFYEPNGAKIIQEKYPSVNYNLLGYDETARRLINIVMDISKKAGRGKVLSVAAGVSGARFEKDRNKLAKAIRESAGVKKVRVVPDTESAFASAFEPGEKNCGILIAGTGSILCYSDKQGNLNRIGGWGRHIGDEGSGYWIAREALYKVTKFYDGRERKSLLADVLKKEFGIAPDNIIALIYSNGFEISSLTKHVFRCAEKRDKISSAIIRLAAENLCSHFIPLKKEKYKIALTGSLFTEETLLEKHLKKIVKERFSNIRLIKPSQKPVWGAVKIAMTDIK